MSDEATGGIKPKHQRLVLIILAVVALIGATLLAMVALQDQASYFYVPEDIEANPPAPGQALQSRGSPWSCPIRFRQPAHRSPPGPRQS